MVGGPLTLNPTPPLRYHSEAAPAAPPGVAVDKGCPGAPPRTAQLARRLMAGHRSLEPGVVVRLHPGQLSRAA